MFKNILIIGFGMIGSSIARTVVKNNKLVKVYALDKSPSIERRLKKAKLSSVICLKSFDEVDQKHIDLIIICTPVLQYKSIFHKISKLKHSKFIVTDVGSTKLNIEKIYKSEKFKFRFVPSHPIAGIEKSGLEYGFIGLFDNRYNIICPLKNTLNQI